MNQNNLILDYLKKGNAITPLEGLRLFGTFRLGARIFDLKTQGHNIETKTIYTGKKHFASYRLKPSG